jgi:hypothetical protein
LLLTWQHISALTPSTAHNELVAIPFELQVQIFHNLPEATGDRTALALSCKSLAAAGIHALQNIHKTIETMQYLASRPVGLMQHKLCNCCLKSRPFNRAYWDIERDRVAAEWQWLQPDLPRFAFWGDRVQQFVDAWITGSAGIAGMKAALEGRLVQENWVRPRWKKTPHQYSKLVFRLPSAVLLGRSKSHEYRRNC